MRELGLSHYSWLPHGLRIAFQRKLEDDHQTGVSISVTLPPTLPWAGGSRAPKNGPKQHEDPERNVTWLYRATVKRPPDSYSTLQRDFGIASWNTIDKGIKRAQQLLACVNKELPTI